MKIKLDIRKRDFLLGVAVCVVLAIIIGFLAEKYLVFFRSHDGVCMFFAITIFFVISKVAQALYNKGHTGDCVLLLVISADMFTIATLGLNLAGDYVEANPLLSILTIGICSFILLLAMFITHDGSVTNISSHDGSEGVDIKALAVKLGSDTECIKLDIQRIKKSLGDVKKTFYTLLGAIIAVALGLAGLMAKGFGWL